MCACVWVCPVLLDRKQLIHYSKQAFSLCSPSSSSSVGSVVVRTLQNSKEQCVCQNVLIIWKGHTGRVMHAYESLPATELCLCALSLSSGVFPLSCFGPNVHFTLKWISWTAISFVKIEFVDVFFSTLHHHYFSLFLHQSINTVSKVFPFCLLVSNAAFILWIDTAVQRVWLKVFGRIRAEAATEDDTDHWSATCCVCPSPAAFSCEVSRNKSIKWKKLASLCHSYTDDYWGW